MYDIHNVLFEYTKFIKDTDVKRIEINDDSLIITSRENSIKIVCEKNDQRIAPFEIMNFNSYEKNDSKIIDQLIKNHFTIFDIGANFGWYSLNFAKMHKLSKIYAFEPIPKTYKKLVENITINNLNNITSVNFGLYNKNTDLTFYYYEQGSGNASSKNLEYRKNTQKLICSVITLDDFIIKNNISSLDFIKCDVEGGELFVFEGGSNSIDLHRPIIFTEMLRKWSEKHEYHPNKIIDFFKAKNYRCFISNKSGLSEIVTINNDTIETNFFFLHDEKHASIISSLTNI